MHLPHFVNPPFWWRWRHALTKFKTIRPLFQDKTYIPKVFLFFLSLTIITLQLNFFQPAKCTIIPVLCSVRNLRTFVISSPTFDNKNRCISNSNAWEETFLSRFLCLLRFFFSSPFSFPSSFSFSSPFSFSSSFSFSSLFSLLSRFLSFYLFLMVTDREIAFLRGN